MTAGIDPIELRWLLEDKYRFSRQQATELVASWTETGSFIGEEQLSEMLQQDLEALRVGMPVAYLIGWMTFLGCHIDLSLRPLIPRPETEYWVEQFVTGQLRKSAMRPLKVLDLCCGSGCVGIAVLSKLPHVSVTFVDIDSQMLQQTKLSAQLNKISSERYHCVQSDLLSGISEQFDVILTNPPYVDPFGEVSPSLQFEPPKALFAQNSGLALIEKILSKAQSCLKTEGEMWLEFGADQDKRVQQLAEQAGWEIRVEKDQFGINRFAILTRMSVV